MKKKRRKRISVKSAKAKGRHFQHRIKELFIRAGGADTTGRLASEDIESRQMGGAGEDVIFHGKRARWLFPFYVECKAHKKGFNPHKIFDTLSEFAAKTSTWPLLFHRRDRGDRLVTMPTELFEHLLTVAIEQSVDLRERLNRKEENEDES